jgi:ankyrin repeat protein
MWPVGRQSTIERSLESFLERTTWREGPHEMKKRCRACRQLLDSSSFYDSNQEPDGLESLCRSCVNKRRRERHATKSSKTRHADPPRIQDLVKKGDFTAVKKNRNLIDASNRQYLLTLAVRDFKSAPKKPTHVELVKFLIQLGAKPHYHPVCAATVGPHIDIMNALIEAGAEQNIFTAAALGEVDRVRDLLSTDPAPGDKTTDIACDEGMTALHYACMSELGKVNQAYADPLFLCALLLLDRSSAPRAEFDRRGSAHGFGSPLNMCASGGGNVKIAQLLMRHGWRPTGETLLAALGHFQRHGKGNYDVAALCLESGVDINEDLAGRTLLHAFAHQGDIVGTRWLVDHGAKIDARDQGNNTPLHKACERNSTLTIVKLLLERGASLTAVNNNGETALDVATNYEKKSIAAFLKLVGAKPGVGAPIANATA